ncbi:Multifunctional methyltransferase subunit TRM112-like protein [Porphyridium purpureum]|uniref:Multifunctional methyltransferase subunit TRM112-like protein n=1 Tax=Porphyridium purpureum TaxID=35688 RepID=A0A5J4YSM0_PORPP|nr:Multifunctional methyltransferase subunit TRM112-like protein [Porphyridium purpureum]|eukprot:POR7174..scf229_5
MRLLTHNFMCSPRTKAYPLRLVPAEIEMIESAYNPGFVQHVLPRIEWEPLRATALACGLGELPPSPPQDPNVDEDVWRLLHRILLDTHVKEGILVSPSGAEYTIHNSIPNMLPKTAADAEPKHVPQATDIMDE